MNNIQNIRVAKAIFVSGGNAIEIEDTAKLLQEFLNQTSSDDLRKLLIKAKANPSLVKKALKFI